MEACHGIGTNPREIRQGQWRISTHAAVEAAKDGVSPKDIKEIVFTGKIIESYPDRQRHLIYGVLPNMSNLSVHVVIDYSDETLDCRCHSIRS